MSENDMAKIARLVADSHADERADRVIQKAAMAMGSSDEWTDQETMIADFEERFDALRARVAKLEAALKEARIEFEMWHEAKNILAKIDAALKDTPQ